jgi:hypothetical protein
VLINYSPQPLIARCAVQAGWAMADTWYGQAPKLEAQALSVEIPPNDALVLLLEQGSPRGR